MPGPSTVANVNEDMSLDARFTPWAADCYCGRLFTQPQPGYSVIITSPNGLKSDIVFVTQVLAGSKKIGNAANYTAEDGLTYANKIFNGYYPGSTISFFNRNIYSEVSYYILNNSLMRDRQAINPLNGQIIPSTPETIAINIEDLQLSFGLDTDADGSVDFWVDDRDLSDPEKDQVRLVEINVLGKTDSEHRGYSNSRPEILDHTAGVTSDGFRRKQLQVTIKVRNLGLQ